MTMTQTRRRFLTSPHWPAPPASLARGAALGRGAGARNDHRSVAKVAGICFAPQYVAEELLRAEGFTDVRYVRSAARPHTRRSRSARQVRFRSHFAPRSSPAIDRGDAITILAGVHVGCFELFAKDGIRSIADLKGKRWESLLGIAGILFLPPWPPMSGSIRPRTSTGSTSANSVKPMELFAERQGRRVSRLSSRAAGSAGAEDQPCHRQQRRGPAVVAVFLLHAGGQPRTLCGRYPIATKRVVRAILKADRSLRQRARRARATIVDGGFTPSYDYALQTLDRGALRQMARIRPRGHAPLLCAATARSRDDQIEPAEDHRRRHRLALFRTRSNAS